MQLRPARRPWAAHPVATSFGQDRTPLPDSDCAPCTQFSVSSVWLGRDHTRTVGRAGQADDPERGRARDRRRGARQPGAVLVGGDPERRRARPGPLTRGYTRRRGTGDRPHREVGGSVDQRRLDGRPLSAGEVGKVGRRCARPGVLPPEVGGAHRRRGAGGGGGHDRVGRDERDGVRPCERLEDSRLAARRRLGRGAGRVAAVRALDGVELAEGVTGRQGRGPRVPARRRSC